MKRITIELRDELADALAAQASLAGFASPDEYVATLVEGDRLRLERLRREAEINREAAAHPPRQMTEEDWRRLKQEIDRRLPRPRVPLEDLFGDDDSSPPASSASTFDMTDEQREEHRRRLGGRDACGD